MVKIVGGDKLAARLAEISRHVSKSADLSVGFLEGATYPDGTPVALIAAIQEFGAPGAGQRTSSGRASAHGRHAVQKELGLEGGIGIPPRPFFRNMIAEKSPEWPDAIAGLLKATDYDATKTMMQVGEGIKGQLQQSIVDTNSPPIAPATVKAKGFDKPLVDTGHMLNSIDYTVK